MKEFDKLERVLDADSSEDVVNLAIERIQELTSENAEKQKVIDELETKRLLRENETLRKSIAELDKEEARLQEILLNSTRHEKKLFADADSEIDKLKIARMNTFRKAHDLPEDNSAPVLTKMNKHSVVSDSTPYRKALCYDGLDSEVDALKAKRMNVFEDARKW